MSAVALENGKIRRTAVSVHGLALLTLGFQSLGIIYSDIGTSPLYVLNGIWPAEGPVPSQQDVIGGISAIIWSLTLIPLLKYVLIGLQFGTHEGEGGTFALYQGLFPQHTDAAALERCHSEVRDPRKPVPTISRRLRWPLLILSLLGTSLTLADGIFTPAVSVTSAVGGIAIAKASISAHVIPISVAFLFVLFIAQPFGTSRLANVFAPITFVWFLLLAGTGIVNIIKFPGIFRAFDPSRGIMLFVRTGNYGLLSGVLLSMTGSEALFANLGQFNMLSIQLSFGFFVYPALCLAYLGQGARLIIDKEEVMSNIFYRTIPGSSSGPLFWIIFVMAILATLTASQALVTATFSLAQQLVHMKSLPPMRMVYTSDKNQGQVYIPAVNWALMLATIITVVAFKSATALEHAYGFAVATVMLVTTILIAIQMRYVKYWPAVSGVAFLVFFGFLDALFWGAALKKIPQGAWVPVLIGTALVSLMAFWTWAKGLEDAFDASSRRDLRQFIGLNGDPCDPSERNVDETQSFTTSSCKSEKELECTDPIRFDIASGLGAGAHVAGTLKRPCVSRADSVATMVNVQEVQPEGFYYMACDKTGGECEKEKQPEARRDLVRTATCAIFHNTSAAKGVPHSFVGFVRQWPALPRIVIFLSVEVLPVAHVHQDERYIVNKGHGVEGFYSVTYYLGFRDELDAKVDDVVGRICTLETSLNPKGAAETVDAIKRYAARYTHIVPHYRVKSRELKAGVLSKPLNGLRSLLVGGLYRHMAAIFSFSATQNWLNAADEIIYLGVNAII